MANFFGDSNQIVENPKVCWSKISLGKKRLEDLWMKGSTKTQQRLGKTIAGSDFLMVHVCIFSKISWTKWQKQSSEWELYINISFFQVLFVEHPGFAVILGSWRGQHAVPTSRKMQLLLVSPSAAGRCIQGTVKHIHGCMNPSTIIVMFPRCLYGASASQPFLVCQRVENWTSHEGIFHMEKRNIIFEHTTGWGYVSSQEGTFLHQMLYWTGKKGVFPYLSHFLFQVLVGKIRVSGNFHSSSPSEIRVAFFSAKERVLFEIVMFYFLTRAIHVWYIYLQLGWLYGFHVGRYTWMLWAITVITNMSFGVSNMMPKKNKKKTSCFTKFNRIINLDLFLRQIPIQ